MDSAKRAKKLFKPKCGSHDCDLWVKMGSAKRAKERLMNDKVEREISRLKANNDASEDAGMKWAEEAMKLQGEVKSLKVERDAARAERDRWRKETKKTRVKLAGIEEAARELCDVTELDGEGAEHRQLRRFVWNYKDTEALREAEGIDE